MNIKCLLNKHDYEFLWKIKGTQQKVYQCKNCGCYYIYDYGIGVGCKEKTLLDYEKNKE